MTNLKRSETALNLSIALALVVTMACWVAHLATKAHEVEIMERDLELRRTQYLESRLCGTRTRSAQPTQ